MCPGAFCPLERIPALESSLPTLAYPVMASLSQVMHEEPEHVAVKQVSVVQAVFIPFPLVLLNHLGSKEGWGRGWVMRKNPGPSQRRLAFCPRRNFPQELLH